MNPLKNSILAGTLALTTSCSSLSDLLHFGEEPTVFNSPAVAEMRRVQDARRMAQDVAADVVYDAHFAFANQLIADGYPDTGRECLALTMSNNYEAAMPYCYGTWQGVGAATHVRWALLGMVREAFDEEQHAAIYRYLMPTYYAADEGRETALEISEAAREAGRDFWLVSRAPSDDYRESFSLGPFGFGLGLLVLQLHFLIDER
ncbi:hypothetical protein HYS49_03870 [Candidatus Woesearchaeota archaeon]|nr:hypothetical protein [Candidatus Woesearchaeota archaeon]